MSAVYSCDRCRERVDLPAGVSPGQYHLPCWRGNLIVGGPEVLDWDDLHLCDRCIKSLRNWVAMKPEER